MAQEQTIKANHFHLGGRDILLKKSHSQELTSTYFTQLDVWTSFGLYVL